MVVIDAWSRYFVELLSRLVRQITISFHTSLHDQKIFREWQVFLLQHRKFEIQTWFCNCPQYLCFFTLSLSASQIYMVKERCWVSLINFFIEYFPHRIKILLLSNQFYVIHIHIYEKFFLTVHEKKKHSQFGIFSHPCFTRIFSNCLSHNSPAKG